MQIKSKFNQLAFNVLKIPLLKKGYFGVDEYSNYSFSQMGEDRILSIIFGDRKKGYYVDVGAFHPKLYSNTYVFYLTGWRGINIDPNEENIELFNSIRPKDINLSFGVSGKKSEMKYYLFSNPAVNTFSEEFAKKISSKGQHKIIKTENVKTFPLSHILDKYLSKNKKIDFLNIDVEGNDLEVLESNNWSRYKPEVILVEDIDFDFDNMEKSKIYKFLKKKGYFLKAKTNETLIFKRIK